MRPLAAALVALLLLGGSLEAQDGLPQDGLPLPAGRFREVELLIHGKRFRELRLSRTQVSDDEARDLATRVSGVTSGELPKPDGATATFTLLYFTQSIRPIRVEGYLEEAADKVAVPADPAYDAVRPLLSSLVDRIAKSEEAKAKEVAKALEGSLVGTVRSTNLGLTLTGDDGTVYYVKNKGDDSLTKLLQSFIGFPVCVRAEIAQGVFGDPAKHSATIKSVVGLTDHAAKVLSAPGGEPVRDAGTGDGRAFIDITGLSTVEGKRYVRVDGGYILIGEDMTPGLYAPGDPLDPSVRVIPKRSFPEDSRPATTHGFAGAVERAGR
jgi:hypothetical protein